MIQAEADDPSHCAKPALMAYDDRVTQPFAVAAE